MAKNNILHVMSERGVICPGDDTFSLAKDLAVREKRIAGIVSCRSKGGAPVSRFVVEKKQYVYQKLS